MPLYTVRQRGADQIRIIEAPTNRTVLMHLAAEMFEVALVKIEVIAAPAPAAGEPEPQVETEVPEQEPEPTVVPETTTSPTDEPPKARRGRPRKHAPEIPPPVQPAVPPAGEKEAEAVTQPNSQGGPPAASEALLAAEAERVEGRKFLFERMSDLARDNSPAPANTAPQADVNGEGAAVATRVAPEHAPATGFDAAGQQEGADQQRSDAAPSETDDEQAGRPEPMFEE